MSSVAHVAAAIADAGVVSLAAYELRRGSPMERALERAAERGAQVTVTLNGRTRASGESAAVARANEAAARALRAHGAVVRVAGGDDVPVHLKAAVVDGVAYLDDRNWAATGPEMVVALTDAPAVAAVGDALAGRAAGTPDLALDKARALRLEAQAIYDAPGDRIDVESESFGASVVSRALRYRAEHGAHVRLLVAARELRSRRSAAERGTIRRLHAAGVEVRASSANEKLCVTGDRGWVGSANATYAGAPMRDWGLATRDSALLASLESHFNAAWMEAKPSSGERT